MANSQRLRAAFHLIQKLHQQPDVAGDGLKVCGEAFVLRYHVLKEYTQQTLTQGGRRRGGEQVLQGGGEIF